MPITKSARKAVRQSGRKNTVNRKVKQEVHNAISAFKNKPSLLTYKKVVSEIDQAAKKKVIHINKASRIKSRLAKLLKEKASFVPPKKSPAKKSPRSKMAKK